MKTIQSEAEFREISNGDTPVVVKFYTTWCPDCARLNNFIDDVIADFHSFSWYEIDKDKFPEIAEEYQVMGIPSLLVFKNGKKLGHLHSANAKTEEQVHEFLQTI
ncbi:thioredoxin family protein [Ectobacillus polymachus]|uniref:thioredoxin family protein n=1 Tax=Ectobacillus polymachus TaxID=1508806 RepID=UPI003A897C69